MNLFGWMRRTRPSVPVALREGLSTRGTMSILSKNGDDKVCWDVADTTTEGLAAVQEAERVFKEHRKAGYLAFKTEGATGGEVLKQFDPMATDIVLVPPVVGG